MAHYRGQPACPVIPTDEKRTVRMTSWRGTALDITAIGSNDLLSLTKVTWNRAVDKEIGRVPDVIARKFRIWVALVEESGIREVRRCKGFHDEPLKGTRRGQRSVRLNKAYRAIYVERETGEVELIEVLEVNKHEY